MVPGEIRVGPAMAGGPFVVREIAYAAGLRQARHAHEYMGVTLVYGGAIRESAGAREELGGVLSVVVKPAGVEHADEVGPLGARTLQIAFDPVAAGAVLDGQRSLVQWRWVHADITAAAMLALLRLTRWPAAARAADIEQNVLDVLGTIGPDTAVAGAAPVWLRRVKDALADGAAQASVRALAREAGVHEVSLSRAFRRHYRCTISEYRQRQRVRRAAQYVEVGTARLSWIAHAAGYADHAHFCREFRRSTGVSPSAFRDLTRTDPPPHT